MPNFATGLSLCMIVRDEERFLDDALRSVAGIVDEICIVDTGSTDRTIEIAHAHGATVREIPWNDDFAAARNAALAMATRRWIVVLDADERLAPDSRSPLAAIGRERPGGRGKWIVCRNLTDDCKGSGAMTNALVRIFPNDARIRYRNSIHEFVALDGSDTGLPADVTPIEIVHHGYLGAVVSERKKSERNLRMSRAAVERDPADAFGYYNLGMASILAGDPAGGIAALETMRELTRAAPRGFRVHGLVVLAQLYADVRDDVATAIALIEDVLRMVPNYSNAHFAHGTCLARRGDLFEARNAFGRAIAAGAFDRDQFVVDNEIAIWKSQSEIGATLMREHRYAQALQWFALAATARPAAQPLVLNRAKCHEALSEFEAAQTLFAGAFAAYRDEASAIEWINFLLRAGRTGDAVAAIEEAMAFVEPAARPFMLATAAAAHLRAGRWQAARTAIGRALDAGEQSGSPTSVQALARHLGMPDLLKLAPPAPSGRANGLHIAYARLG